MIFQDLQNAIKAELEADAYFSASPAISVFCEDDTTPEAFIENVQAKLNSTGVCVGIGLPDIDIDGRDIASVSIPLVVWENPKLNRKVSSTQKPAFKVATKCAALLTNTQLSLEYWHALKVQSFRRIGHEDGVTAWQVMVKTGTLLETFYSLLETETDAVLTDESGGGLIISPTEP